MLRLFFLFQWQIDFYVLKKKGFSLEQEKKILKPFKFFECNIFVNTTKKTLTTMYESPNLNAPALRGQFFLSPEEFLAMYEDLNEMKQWRKWKKIINEKQKLYKPRVFLRVVAAKSLYLI